MYRVLVAQTAAHQFPISAVKFHKDNCLISASADGNIRVWKIDIKGEISLRSELQKPCAGFGLGVVSLAVRPRIDGCVAAATIESCINLYNLDETESGEVVKDAFRYRKISALKTSPGIIRDVVFHPSKKNLLITSNDSGQGVVCSIDSQFDEQSVTLNSSSTSEHNDNANIITVFQSLDKSKAPAVAVSPDGTFVCLGHVSGVVEAFRFASNDGETAEATIESFSPCFSHNLARAIRCIDISSDSTLTIVGCADGRIYLFDMSTTGGGELIHVFSGHSAPIIKVAASPPGQFITSADASGRVRVWDLKAMECVHQWNLGQQDDQKQFTAVLALGYNEDGTQLAIGSADGTLRVCLVTVPTPRT